MSSRRKPKGSPEPTPREQITVICGGPFIGTMTGGKLLIREWRVQDDHSPMARAFARDAACLQMVIAYPTEGLCRDYRKASVVDVCKALSAEGTEWVLEDGTALFPAFRESEVPA